MSDNKRIDQPTGTETVGHEWDGIEELNTPLPRWWLWSFYACIVFAIGYCVVYPSVPGANGATGGMFKWSSRDQLQKELDKRDAELNQVRQALVAADIHKLEGNEQLMQAAIAGGSAAFKVHCIQCHGAGAAGSKGYPNLNDDDWLWGGDLATIEKTITDGVRQPNHPETRFSQMPAFGRDGLLQPAQIQDVVSFVRVISKQEAKRLLAARQGDLRGQLRGVPRACGPWRPDAGRPEPHRCDLALWRRSRDDHPDRHQQPLRRDAGLGPASRQGDGTDARGLCPFAGRWRGDAGTSTRRERRSGRRQCQRTMT